jgi:arylsulfatase A-like enzyme
MNVRVCPRLFLFPGLGCVLSLLLCAWPAHGEEPKRALNVVFFLVDDLGQRDLGCFGSAFYETPNIDRLAREGVRLTDAYAACPVCSPTRASLLTGRYPQRCRITDYIGAAQPAQWTRNTRHLPAPYAEALEHEELTLAEVLRSAGYATFFGGKWHLGGVGFLPEDHGFDVNFAGLLDAAPRRGKKYFSPYGNPKLSDGPDGEHICERLATEAAGFIEHCGRRPFFVYLPFYSVHTPLMTRPELEHKYQEKRRSVSEHDRFGDEPPRKVRLSQDHAVYAGMVETLDRAIGIVLDSLERQGLAENTLVVFTSDNGGLSTSEGSPTANVPWRAGKGWLYEGGVRVPAIVRLSGRVPAGCVSAVPTISPDWLPTICEATGVPLPQTKLDGVSVWPALLGREPATATPRPLFWHYPHYGNQGGAPGAAVREGAWKFLEWFDDGHEELFNLADDPSEARNRLAEAPEQAAVLRERLHAWQRDVGAVMTTPNPTYDPNGPNGRR